MEKFARPIVYWSCDKVALHYMAQGDRTSKVNCMLEMPLTPENTHLLVTMCNAGRAALGFPPQNA